MLTKTNREAMAGTLPEMLEEPEKEQRMWAQNKHGCAQRASKLRMECPNWSQCHKAGKCVKGPRGMAQRSPERGVLSRYHPQGSKQGHQGTVFILDLRAMWERAKDKSLHTHTDLQP